MPSSRSCRKPGVVSVAILGAALLAGSCRDELSDILARGALQDGGWRELSAGARQSGLGVVRLRSAPPLAAVWVDGRFAGMTGQEGGELVMTLPAAEYEMTAGAPGHVDVTWRHRIARDEETALEIVLPAPEAAAAAPGFSPLVGLGQTVRARFAAAGGAGQAVFRIRGAAGERRLVVLQTPGVRMRLRERDRLVEPEAMERVAALAGQAFLEVAFAEDGELELVFECDKKRAGDRLVFKLMAPPPPLLPPEAGSDRRRRQPGPLEPGAARKEE